MSQAVLVKIFLMVYTQVLALICFWLNAKRKSFWPVLVVGVAMLPLILGVAFYVSLWKEYQTITLYEGPDSTASIELLESWWISSCRGMPEGRSRGVFPAGIDEVHYYRKTSPSGTHTYYRFRYSEYSELEPCIQAMRSGSGSHEVVLDDVDWWYAESSLPSTYKTFYLWRPWGMWTTSVVVDTASMIAYVYVKDIDM